MKKLYGPGIAAAIIIAAPDCANAYPANIVLVPPAKKKPSDDMVVIDQTFTLDRRSCFFQTQSQNMALCPDAKKSVNLYLVPPNRAGFSVGFYTKLNALDVMTDDRGWVDGATYHLKVAFTPDFVWIEISDAAAFAPVYSTVFFTGPSQDEYNWYIDISHTTGLGYVNYSSLSSLKTDVQNNYANWAGYPTGVPSGVFRFKQNTALAIFSPGPDATD